MGDATDKRWDFRQRARLDVEVLTVRGMPIPDDLRLVTIDIAASGMRCASNLRLEAETKLPMVITLLGGDLREPLKISATGRVLRCFDRPTSPAIRRYGLAIEFVRMTPEDKKRLKKYLSNL